MRLPTGRLLRGRSLKRGLPGGDLPELGLYLVGRSPDVVPWDARWVRWPDFGLPTDRGDAIEAFWSALERSSDDRVEVACGGGRGRTGTALACIAVLDGLPEDDAVRWVRRSYDPRAVETPWQRRFVLTLRRGMPK